MVLCFWFYVLHSRSKHICFFLHRMTYDIIQYNPKYRACVDRPGLFVTGLQHTNKQIL
jgi:hypothetical protein